MSKIVRVVGLGLALLAGARSASAQNPMTISGVATAENGTPLAGVTIEARSLALGTITRDDGRYTFVIPGARMPNAPFTLTARRIGYKEQTKQVAVGSGIVTVDFTLASNPLRLGEVVVTGAGTSSQVERLGTERKSVDSLALRSANEANVVTALAGKAPNVVVQQQSGEAGGGSRVQIRGVRSLGTINQQGGNLVSTNGQPLFVVDGVPINNSTVMTGSIVGSTTSPNRAADLNPEEIENIEILSGPSASSIYGSLAGNGVVLITTKRGRAGRTSYSLRSNISWDEPANELPFQRKYGVGSGGVRSACVPGAALNCALTAGFFSWGAELPAGTKTWNQAADVFDRGQTFDNTLSMQGGNDRTTFRLSGGAVNQDGYISGDRDYYNKYTAHLSGSHRPIDVLRLGADVQYVRSNMNAFGRGNNTNGVFLPALRTPPDFDSRNYITSDGQHRSYRFPNPGPGKELTNRFFDNPFYVINKSSNPQQTDRTIGSVNANWVPLPWLTVDYVLGADVTADDRLEARPQQSGGTPVGGSIIRLQLNDRVVNSNLTVKAEKNWSDNIRSSFLVGQQLNHQSRRQINAFGNTLVAAEPLRLDNTVSYSPPTDAESKLRLEAYFGQVQVDLWRELFLTASLRNDGASAFDLDNNRIWYPQVQAAWTVSDYVSRVPGVSFAKLRAAYGESGNIPDAYRLQNVYLGQTNPFVDFNPGATLVPTLNGIGGLYSANLRRNPRLKPERVGELSTGADFAFLNNRIDAGVTYYIQQVRDGIVPNFPLPPSTGYTATITNGMRMRNIGLELQTNTRIIDTPDWKLTLGGNYAFNRNKVQSLGDDNTQFVGVGSSFTGRTTNAQVGYPLGVIRGTDFARCRYNEENNFVNTSAGRTDINAVCQAAGAKNGALFIDANGFPIVDPASRNIGNPNPNYTAGLRGTLGWRKVTLGTFVDIRRGGTIQNMTKASMYQYGTHGDTEQRGRTAIFGQNFKIAEIGDEKFAVVGPGAGREVTIGEAWYTGTGSIGGAASQFQEDASYVRLREVSLGVNLDQPWVQRALGVTSVDLRLAGRNLALWSDYTGFDPETSLGGGSVITSGFDWFNTPTSRSIVFTIGLNR